MIAAPFKTKGNWMHRATCLLRKHESEFKPGDTVGMFARRVQEAEQRHSEMIRGEELLQRLRIHP